MDNRLQFLSWLTLLAMLSMMAVQSFQIGDNETRPMASIELRALPTMMAGIFVPTEE